MARHQNAGRIHGIKIDNTSFETVEEFRYLGKTVANKNSIQEEIKSRVKLGNSLLSFGAESFVFPVGYLKQ